MYTIVDAISWREALMCAGAIWRNREVHDVCAMLWQRSVNTFDE